MSIRSLGEFLERLSAAGQLRRLSAPLSLREEVAEATRRVAGENGPALVFQNLEGTSLALATNLLASQQRIAVALGSDSLEEVSPRLPGSAAASPHGGWLNWLKAGLQGGPDSFAPRAVRTAGCQQVVRLGRDVDLLELPALTIAPDEPQTTLWGAIVVSGGGETSGSGLAQCDLPVLDQHRLAIRFGPRDALARQFGSCRQSGQKLPVAVLLGAPPAVILASAAAMREPELDPYILAGLLGGEGLDIVTCRTSPLQVPAEAELVIEGLIDPKAPPLPDVAPGQSGGFRLPAGAAHEIQVTALTQRTQPLVAALVPHAPPNESIEIARAMMRLWMPATRRAIPLLVDAELLPSGLAGQIAVLAIRKQYPGQARQAAAAWWGQLATETTKMVIVVDEGVPVRDAAAVLSEVAAQADPARDVFCFDGPIDHRDFSAPATGFGSRLGIDATAKLPGEQTDGWGKRSEASASVQQKIEALWNQK
jgi:4-hydroxy-3-polyprenylbenzoate decarboxylase